MSTPAVSALEGDTRARDTACREFTRPLVVVAGAGTGKTTTLVARVVTWLVGPGWEASERAGVLDALLPVRVAEGVLAITFTKAAAAEMDARVRGALRDLERGTRPTGVLVPEGVDDATIRARARRLRLALDGALATTIHGFCQSLLFEHPLQAGLAPDFTVDADETAIPDFAQRAVEEDMARAFPAGGAQDDDWLRLAREGVGPDGVAHCVAGLRSDGVRSADLVADPTSDARLRELVERLAPVVRAFAEVAAAPLGSVRGAAQVERAVAAFVEIAALVATRDPRDPATFVRALATIDLTDLAVKLAPWSEGDFGKKGADALGEHVGAAQVAARELRAELAPWRDFDLDAFRARRTIVRRVLARAEELGAEAGVLTFGDLLTRAAGLVEGDAALRARLRRRYRQILVDEFQDTDGVQCRLVRALALGPASGRPGLFLVGDPKQSIYGWRGADLVAYDDFVDEVLQAGGERLELVRNFRSTPQVLAAVQRFVEPVMVAQHGVQPPFQVLHAHKSTPGPDPEVWITWQVDPASDRSFAKTRVDDAARFEAAQLARSLRAERDAGTHWKDMAVLLRARTRLDVLLEALRGAEIPFQVEGDRSYYRRREVVDASALVGAIVDPGDTLSLLAYLRSSVGGLPDAALEALWEQGLPGEAQRLGRDPAADARAIERVLAAARTRERELNAQGWPGGRGLPDFTAALGHALESLAVLRRSLRTDTADRFVERMRELVLLESTEAARYQGQYRAANLERFLRRLAEKLDQTGDAAAALRALRRSLDTERDAKEARPSGDVEDAVRFLTIHAAKGLEFDCVYLTGLAAGSNRGGRSGDGFDAASGEQRLCGAVSPGWRRVDEAARAREGAERVRLLYVALTRAKRRLVLSGTWRETFERRDATTATSFADLAEHGLPDEFGVRARLCVDARENEYAIGDIAFRLAIVDDAERAAKQDAQPDPALLARAQSDARRLAELAPIAAERANRLRVGTASTGAQDPRAEERNDIRSNVESAATSRNARALTRVQSQLVGTLVHAALEFAPDFEAARAHVAAASTRGTTGSRQGADARVAAEASAILESVIAGPLGERLTAIADAVVARELPLLAAATDPHGPIDAWIGSADLVYRDGETWVVADFKTESISGVDPKVAARAHAAQLDIYGRALRNALRLAADPRCEVWFLRDGIVAATDQDRAAGLSP